MSGAIAWPDVIGVVGWCLVHFVWQAALVAGAYAALRALLPRGNARYLAAMGALVALAVLPVVTGVYEYEGLARAAEAGSAIATGAAAAPLARPAPAGPGWQALLERGLPWLVLAWAGTAVLLAARVVRQWLRLRAIVACAANLPGWQLRASRFGARMGLHRFVPVLASIRIATPTLVGWLRPVVVLPVSVLTQMPPAQIDLVLAHELAHLKRCDHFANLFQVVLETMFFYHPAVHWISRDARNEREVCCDALALRATGGARRDFIEALASLAELRAGHGTLALAADGGVLVERAAFIAGVGPGRRRRSLAGGLWVGLAIAALALAGGAWWRHAALQSAHLGAIASAGVATVTRNAVAGLVDAAAVPALAPAVVLRFAPLPKAVAAVPTVTPRMADAAVVPIAPGLPLPTPEARVTPPRLAPMAVPVPPPPAAAGAAVAPAVPKAVHTVSPVYPPEAMVQGIQGAVVVEFTLTPRGVPQDLRVVRSGTGPLDAAALQALSEWRFAPAPGAVGRTYRQSFTFRLGAGPGAAGGCLVLTGTHVCRDLTGTPSAVRTLARRP